MSADPDRPGAAHGTATDATDSAAAHGTAGFAVTGRRTLWRASCLNDKTLRRDERVPAGPSDANLVASLAEDGSHLVTLDIDHPARLVASSSPGHSHLFVDVAMSWRAYRRLLRALYLGGVIGRNAYWRSLDRGASFVRAPGVTKSAAELARAEAGRTTVKRAATRALWAARVRVTLRRPCWWCSELAGLARRR